MAYVSDAYSDVVWQFLQMVSSCASGVQLVGDAGSAGGAVSTGLVPLVM